VPPVYVFDVNETLLDLRALDAHFGRAFGDPGAREAWFQQLIQSALVTIATGRYHDFGTIATAALETTAALRGVTLAEADKQAIVQGMGQLPPHREVPAALARLRDGGLRLAALTTAPARSPRRSWPTPASLSCSSRSCPRTRLGGSSPPPSPIAWPPTPWACRSNSRGWWPRTAGTSPGR
jgi:hypothetical protein